MFKHKDERPVISFRVNKTLKDKILSVYGDYTPLEHVLEEHFLGEITPPSVISDDIKKIKELEKLKKTYNDIYNSNEKSIKILSNENKQLNNKIKSIDKQILSLESKNNQIKENIKNVNLTTQDTLLHSVNQVTQILRQNKADRELRPTKPVSKKVVKLYSDNCHMSYNKFMEYIPSDLHKCVQ